MSVSHDMMLFLDRTNHCLVCKVPVDVYTRHKNLNDTVEVAGGRTVRSCLEQVLDVSLAGSSAIWLCNKCYSDLEQIQVYYNLVKHFRDRFHNTTQLQGGIAGGIHHGHSGAYASQQYDSRAIPHQSHFTNPNMLLHSGQQNADMLLNLANAGNQNSSIPNSSQTYSKFQTRQPEASQSQQHQVHPHSHQHLPSPGLPNKKVTDGNFLDNILDLQAIPDVQIKKEVEKIVADTVSDDDTIEEDAVSMGEPTEQSSVEECVKSDKISPGVVKDKGLKKVRKETIKEDPTPTEDKKSNVTAIECTICEQSFKTENRLKRHMLTHRRSGPFKCSICNKGFTSEKQLKLHTLCHVIDTATQEGPSSSDNVTEPDTSTDTKPTPEELMDVKPKGQFTCRICHKSFNESRLLRLHKRTHTSSKYAEAGPMQCPDCEERFDSAEQLKEHLKKQSCDWPWKCHLCDAGFIQEAPLKKHLKTHANESRITCPICHKRLSDAGYMKEHIRTHTGETPHKCAFCEKRFNNASNLKSHERIHTGEKPYKCRVCELAFTQIGQRKVHEATHAGKAPHMCPTCGKEFYWACSYKKHLQTHSDEKPELCSICGKSFRNVPALHAHARSHSDERPHICSYCGKGFKTSKHLSVHKRIHTGEKPFICELCGRGFSQTTGLKFHLKSHNVTSL